MVPGGRTEDATMGRGAQASVLDCGQWFWPDPRVGERQRACPSAECQAERRKKTQAAWRAANSDYFAGRRIGERAAQAEQSAKPPEPLRMPPPLDRLPWDVAQDQFGAQGADFMGLFGKVLVGEAQDS